MLELQIAHLATVNHFFYKLKITKINNVIPGGTKKITEVIDINKKSAYTSSYDGSTTAYTVIGRHIKNNKIDAELWKSNQKTSRGNY